MKEVLKKVLLLQLLLLYSFTIFSFKSAEKSFPLDKLESAIQADKFIDTDLSSKLYSHNIQSESFTNQSSNTPFNSGKQTLKDIFIKHVYSEKIQKVLVLKYLFHFYSSTIIFQQTDIIFPFQYFW